MKRLKIVVDINHPAHVHFFKNFIWEMKKRGHKVMVTAGEKDVAFKLLNNYKIKFFNLGGYGKSLVQKVFRILVLDWRMYKAVKKFKPDVFLGLGSFRASHVAKMMGKPCFLFEDSEPTPIEHAMYLPFVTKVFTPDCFRKSLGKKQIYYRGNHEIAYLHPKWFSPNLQVLKDLGLKKNDKFFILRFVAWQAGHDFARHGFDLDSKRKLINLLSKYGKVMISSEKELPPEFEKFAFRIAPEKMHDALHFATLFAGDSQTMATEAALLGTPAVRCNSFVGANDMGNFVELEKKYKLLFSFNDPDKALQKIEKLVQTEDLKKNWFHKRAKVFHDKVDVTEMMINFVEKTNKN